MAKSVIPVVEERDRFRGPYGVAKTFLELMKPGAT